MPVPVTPLTSAHAHNDYEHARPLLDALDNGFCSVEADVFLVEGKLLVAHERNRVRPERTLQALYLEPLRQHAKKNNGRIYPNSPVSILLLIDIKTDAAATYPVLRTVLDQYRDILTEFGPDTTRPGAVTAVLSGGRPPLASFAAEKKRLSAYDGRPGDLDGGASPSVMPLVSESWEALSSWWGAPGVPLPDADLRKVQEIIRRAHQKGYRVRFWAIPDTPVVWRTMRDLGVDLINTDDLPGLRRFLTTPPPVPAAP
ncbi:MAG: hypothetical protein H7Z41_08225 [Cytophagales bacterium]|nr:hypothetical protein [Armatimonadota bacterium]